jgi:hypothetical protein
MGLMAQGAIQSDAALRQSTEGRQMAAATLSVGVLLAILEAAPEIRVPFRVDSHHIASSEGNLKEAAVIETSRIAKVRSVSASLWIAPHGAWASWHPPRPIREGAAAKLGWRARGHANLHVTRVPAESGRQRHTSGHNPATTYNFS